ncbi:MAG: DUF2071 domain-containing protein [Micromonosporaceae bacterium]|nr:DUF2071 domain-containing protein [Micromonosporaceae bacterium]
MTRTAFRAVRAPILSQSWRHLTFVHWPVPPDRVAPLLPPGVQPDVLDGQTYVGLVALQMVGVGPVYGPGVPYLGTFPETNVRLYTVDRQGRRGVTFLSMDAARLVPVLVARGSFRLPYRWSRMGLTHRAGRLAYGCWRRWPRPRVASAMVATVGEPIEKPSALEDFVTARWGLHVAGYGRTWYLPNEHPPWRLYAARLERLADGLVAAAGLPGVADEPPVSVLYSPGLAVRFGAPHPVPAWA